MTPIAQGRYRDLAMINHCSGCSSKGFADTSTRSHAGVACEIAPTMAFLGKPICFFRGEEKMIRIFVVLIAAAALFAACGHARAQGGYLDSRDIIGGGPNFFGTGASPIP